MYTLMSCHCLLPSDVWSSYVSSLRSPQERGRGGTPHSFPSSSSLVILPANFFRSDGNARYGLNLTAGDMPISVIIVKRTQCVAGHTRVYTLTQ